MSDFTLNLVAKELSPYFSEPHTPDERKKMVGENLVQLRKLFHLTQKEVSEIINVTPQTYSGYEKGKYEPSMETLVRLSFLYHTSIDLLLLRNDFSGDQTGLDNAAIEWERNEYEEIKDSLALMKYEIEELKKQINRPE